MKCAGFVRAVPPRSVAVPGRYPVTPIATRGILPLHGRGSARVVTCVFYITLAACSTPPEPKIIVREVSVPVAVKCSPSLQLSDGYPDSAEALRGAADLFERVKLMLAGRALRDGDLAQLKAAIKGCTG